MVVSKTVGFLQFGCVLARKIISQVEKGELGVLSLWERFIWCQRILRGELLEMVSCEKVSALADVILDASHSQDKDH